MKRIVLLLLASLPMLVQAQNVSWKFFDRYTKAEGFTSVQLERKMMRMMSRQAAEKGDEQAKAALDVWTYRIQKYIGAYNVAVGGADAIVFTAVSSSPMPRPLRPLRTTASIW